MIPPQLRWAGRLFLAALLVSATTFAMAEALPGDAAFRVAAARYDAERVPEGAVAAIRAELGLDRPAGERLLRWWAATATGELGRSAVTGEPVSRTLLPPLRRSLALVALAWPLALLGGVGGGLLLSRSRAGLAAAGLLGAVASGVPSYVLGLLLGGVFALGLGWLPVAGFGGPAFVVLPAATLALPGAARLALVTARSCAAAGEHPSIAFARMKAVGRWSLLFRHLLPLAAPPVVAYAFVGLVFLLEGAAAVETVFAYPGLGRLVVDAVRARDVPVVQGAALFLALGSVAANGAAELLAGAASRRVVGRPGP